MSTRKKIVIVNRRYFPSSGPEAYLFNITPILESDNFEVIPFSVKRKWNVKTKYDKYFVNSPYGLDTLYYSEAKLNLFRKLKLFCNAIYSFEAKTKMEQLIKTEKPDIVYLFSIVNDISPSIIHACKKHNIPVIVRLSDYYLLCASYIFLRNNEFCKLCLTKNHLHGLKNLCVKDEFLPTLTRTLSLMTHNMIKIYDYVDAYICTCSFMKRVMIEGGFPEHKLHIINSFVNSKKYEPNYKNGDYILYFGRISPEKGLDYLLKAKAKMKHTIPLHIIGDASDTEYIKSLKNYVLNNNMTDVTFSGFKKPDELKKFIGEAKFVVIPSICADNSPVSAIESMAIGKPLIGSDMGGITDQITKETGFLVPPKDVNLLAEKMDFLVENDEIVDKMSRNARINFEENFSEKQHYTKLKKIIKTCMEGAKK